MKFGAFFVGQRPLLHEQYADESKINPNPVSRTDVEVYQDILRGAEIGGGTGLRLGVDCRARFQRTQHHQLAPQPAGRHRRQDQAGQGGRGLHHSAVARSTAAGAGPGHTGHYQPGDA